RTGCTIATSDNLCPGSKWNKYICISTATEFISATPQPAPTPISVDKTANHISSARTSALINRIIEQQRNRFKTLFASREISQQHRFV
ncbi:hypothetical protein, partial [Acidocella sp. KAb 2-4]|uniref:hypothetical protein n=1 Tax=Acidocella sp. KAb 2-4 TaxID=2885158 RepID=UPI001D0720A4